MTISKNIAKIMLFGAIVGAGLIYLGFANTLSETDMVNLSYIWFPIAVTGGMILFKGNHTLKFALTTLIISFLLLFIFFVQIFPML